MVWSAFLDFLGQMFTNFQRSQVSFHLEHSRVAEKIKNPANTTLQSLFQSDLEASAFIHKDETLFHQPINLSFIHKDQTKTCDLLSMWEEKAFGLSRRPRQAARWKLPVSCTEPLGGASEVHRLALGLGPGDLIELSRARSTGYDVFYERQKDLRKQEINFRF